MDPSKKECVEDSCRIVINDDLYEKTKQMGYYKDCGDYIADDEKIKAILPTGNQYLDKHLYFYLKYKELLKMKNLSYRYEVKYTKSELKNFPLLKLFVDDHYEEDRPFEPFFSYT